jgi:hypothetical protein
MDWLYNSYGVNEKCIESFLGESSWRVDTLYVKEMGE